MSNPPTGSQDLLRHLIIRTSSGDLGRVRPGSGWGAVPISDRLCPETTPPGILPRKQKKGGETPQNRLPVYLWTGFRPDMLRGRGRSESLSDLTPRPHPQKHSRKNQKRGSIPTNRIGLPCRSDRDSPHIPTSSEAGSRGGRGGVKDGTDGGGGSNLCPHIV